ncbi:MAG: hypothetical protein PHQ04_06050 [Opitutaceae bacterium]|nr:hypothetical protein [Opitutaceae bacterium]
MPLKLPDALKPPPRVPRVVLLPADRFFVRRVPLAPEGDAAVQVELALEGLAPFPVAQLYYGFLPAPDRASALVFAAYRRRFTTDETGSWAEAAAVLPAFAALLAVPPKHAATILHANGLRLAGLAWDGKEPLPAGALAREMELSDGKDAAPVVAPGPRADFAAGLAGRLGQAGKAERWLEGATTVAAGAREGSLVLTTPGAGGSPPLVVELDAAQLATLDVRDKGVLAVRARDKARDLVLWRVFAACVLGLAAAFIFELGFGLGSHGLGPLLLKTRKATVQKQAPGVQKIQTARELAQRVGELSVRRLAPFDMLDYLNRKRPATIWFGNATTEGLYKLVVSARTANTADVGNYQSSLRTLRDVVASVEVSNLLTREGQTTFTLTVVFKPEALQKGGRS